MSYLIDDDEVDNDESVFSPTDVSDSDSSMSVNSPFGKSNNNNQNMNRKESKVFSESESEDEDPLWKKRFSERTNIRDLSKYENLKQEIHEDQFWRVMQKHMCGAKSEEDEAIRTHGTMGWSYMYSVPIQQEFEILKLFFESVYVREEAICLAPALSRPYFVWFDDIDIKSPVPISIAWVKKLCKMIVKSVSEFFPDLKAEKAVPYNPSKHKKDKYSSLGWNSDEGLWMGAGEGKLVPEYSHIQGSGRLRFLVATSGFKEGINKKGKQEYGLGLHVYSIGRILVTEEQAFLIRNKLINDAEILFGTRRKEDGYNPWEEVFDGSVYKAQGGTRMIGSCKVKACSCLERAPIWTMENEANEMKSLEKEIAILSGKDGKMRTLKAPPKLSNKANCSICQNRGKYLEKKAYEPKFVLDYNGKQDRDMEEIILERPLIAILASNIRTRIVDLEDNYWRELKGYTLQMIPKTADAKELKRLEKRNYKNVTTTASEKDGKEAGIGKFYGKDHPLTIAALHQAQSLDDSYIGMIPERLKRTGLSKYILVPQTSSKGANWCMRCSIDHENRSYFAISPKFISQHSYSDNIECKTAPTPKKRIDDPDLIESLFGQTIFKKDPDLGVTSVNIPKPVSQKMSPRNREELTELMDYYVKKRKEWFPEKVREERMEKVRKTVEKKTLSDARRLSSKTSIPLDQLVTDNFVTDRQVHNELIREAPPKKNVATLIKKDKNGISWGTIVY